MRKIERPASPECLAAGAPKWTEEYLAVRHADSSAAFSWRSQGCYREIRRQLTRMTQTHCAFCDGALGVESRETVEHFRPKESFPEVAYTWDNLFPCCDLCQSKKLKRFDEALLKPDSPGYQFTHYFVVNYKTGRLEPSPHSDDTARRRAEVTIEIYGLNLPKRQRARIREWEHFCRDPAPCIDDYNYRYILE